MPKLKNIGIITATKSDGSEIDICVDKQGGSIYLRTPGYRHMVHPSNECEGPEGWVREAALVFNVSNGRYMPI